MSVSEKPLEKKILDREEFIKENLGLVHACAHKLSGKGAEYDDLFGAGCVGLIKAFDGFDESLGFKFSTYAVPVILGEMKRLWRDGGSVKISRSVKELSSKISKEESDFSKRNGREPTISELSKALGKSEEEITEAICASQPTVSLNSFEESPFSSKESESCEESICEKISLREAVLRLEEREREIVELRFYKLKTQTETANALGMTQVQISRKEKKILEKLRRLLL